MVGKGWGDTRWHQDSDQWVWRIYDSKGAVTSDSGENTSNTYIVPYYGKDEGWWIVDATTLYEQHVKEKITDWVKEVNDGKAVRVAGPFNSLDSAKSAWRVMYG